MIQARPKFNIRTDPHKYVTKKADKQKNDGYIIFESNKNGA